MRPTASLQTLLPIPRFFGALVAVALGVLPHSAVAQPKKPDAPVTDPGYGTDAALKRSGAPVTPTPTPTTTSRPALPEAQLTDLVSRGVVGVYVQGKRVALGAVLHGDGRVLTALSPLNGVAEVELRRADGTTIPAKVLHRDANVDLALLVPQSGIRREGFLASEADPAMVALSVPHPAAKGNAFVLSSQQFKKKGSGRNGNGIPLADLVQFGPVGKSNELPLVGAPLVDGGGGVVGIVVPACDADKQTSCVKIAAAAGIGAIRNFLRTAPSNAVPPPGWLGIVGAPSSDGHVYGVRVVAVAPQGPAERGGLSAGNDLVVAVDGRPVETPESLGAAIAGHAPAEVVKLLVFGGGQYRDVAITLRAAP